MKVKLIDIVYHLTFLFFLIVFLVTIFVKSLFSFFFFLLSCFLFLIPTSDGPKNGRTAAADKLIMNCELHFLPTAIIPRLRSAKTEMNILRARVSCTKTWSKMKNRFLMMCVNIECFPPKKSQ